MKGFPGFEGKSMRLSPLRVIGLWHPSPDTEVVSSAMKGQKDVGVLLGGGHCWTQPLRSGVLRGSSLLVRAATRNLKRRATISAEGAPSWQGGGREDCLQEVSVSILEDDLGKKKPTVWCCFTRNACYKSWWLSGDQGLPKGAEHSRPMGKTPALGTEWHPGDRDTARWVPWVRLWAAGDQHCCSKDWGSWSPGLGSWVVAPRAGQSHSGLWEHSEPWQWALWSCSNWKREEMKYQDIPKEAVSDKNKHFYWAYASAVEHIVTGSHWGQELKETPEGLVSYAIARLSTAGTIHNRFQRYPVSVCSREELSLSRE